MKESGCDGVYLGLESGCDEVLENMNKKATIKEYQRGLDSLKENDITTFASFIVGFPGESNETVPAQLNLLRILALISIR